MTGGVLADRECLHQTWLFDGDDPYLICSTCHERRDALTARIITPGRLPVRVQRTRGKGSTLPPGAVYVGRPTPWGNPWRVGETIGGLVIDQAAAVRAYRATVHLRGTEFTRQVQAALGGHDLACWCPLDQLCHADILLHLANPTKEN